MSFVMMKGPSQRGKKLVHVVGFLDTTKDQVANIKGTLPDVAIMVAM
jgi:hypothetical protein